MSPSRRPVVVGVFCVLAALLAPSRAAAAPLLADAFSGPLLPFPSAAGHALPSLGTIDLDAVWADFWGFLGDSVPDASETGMDLSVAAGQGTADAASAFGSPARPWGRYYSDRLAYVVAESYLDSRGFAADPHTRWIVLVELVRRYAREREAARSMFDQVRAGAFAPWLQAPHAIDATYDLAFPDDATPSLGRPAGLGAPDTPRSVSSAIPEPGASALLGLAALAWWLRRSQRRAA